MRIERFVGADSKAAMAQVRHAMGADALILANRRRGNVVEITAARDVEDAVGEAPAAGDGPLNELQLKSLERELQHLRGVLQRELGAQRWQDTAGRNNSTVSAVMTRLRNLGLSRSLAGAISDAIPATARLDAAWQHALTALSGRLGVADPAVGTERARIALFGGTGVGKTTAIAKLAARDARRFGSTEIGLISMDPYRIGALEQLHTFASASGIPVLSASDHYSLQGALAQFSKLHRVYIDTAGMSHRDARLYQQMRVVSSVPEPVHCQLVLSASTQPCQSRNVLEGFGARHFRGAIITKVDEATRLGGVLDVIINAGLPLLCVSDGQRVPEDLRRLTAEQFVQRAAQLMDVQGDGRDAVAPLAGVAPG